MDLSRDDRLLYDSLGIRIDLTQKRITVWTTLMSVGFDSLHMILSLVLALVYNSHRKECKKKRGDDLNCQLILHPELDQYQEIFCLIALFSLALSTIFVQTIIQGFILSKSVNWWIKSFSCTGSIDSTLGLRLIGEELTQSSHLVLCLRPDGHPTWSYLRLRDQLHQR